MPVTNAFLSSKLVSKLALRRREKGMNGTHGNVSQCSQWWLVVTISASVYLVHDRGGRGLDAWLLVWEGQLLQQVHVGQGILQGHVGCHGNKVSLTQNQLWPKKDKSKGVKKGHGQSSITESQSKNWRQFFWFFQGKPGMLINKTNKQKIVK